MCRIKYAMFGSNYYLSQLKRVNILILSKIGPAKKWAMTFISDFGEEGMPMWCPPTPPQDDNDIYMDSSLLFLYDGHTMPEQSLPPIFVPKAHKKPKLETITTRKQKQRKEEMPRVPRSLFDKPKEVVNKQRKEAKIQRLRQNLQVPKMLAGRTPISGSQQTQPQQQTVIAKPEPDPTYPEWLVHEEWALLEAVQHIQKLNPDLIIDNPAQITNWDFVSDFVSVVGRIFRAPKHCRYQYENVVLPREDGRIMFNIKPKKSPKSIYKTKNTRPLRTEQLYSQEGLKNFSHLYKIRFEAMLEIGSKRPAPMRQTVNPSAKPTKHASVLGENGINYDSPLPPNQLAMRRAERIAMDKKKQQQQAAAAQQQAQAASVNVGVVDQATAQRTVQAGIVASGVTPAIQGQQLSSIVSVTSNTVLAGQVPKVAVGPGLTAVSIARTIGPTGNIIVNTPAGFPSGTFAALNKRMNQAAALPSTIAVSANLTPTIRGQRSTTVPSATAITMQEVGTIAVGGAASASTTTVTVTSQVARSALQTTVASPSLPAGTLTTQKLAAMATGTSGALQPQLLPHRSLTPQQINILRQNPLNIRGQSSPGTTQQLRAQKLLTAEQIRAQQLKHPQKVITQQLLVPVRGGHSILQGKQAGLLRTTAIPHEQLQALRMRTQIQTQQGKQLQTAQIIQGQVTAVGQSTASTSQSQVALVKSVSASPSVTVPMTLPVTGISVGQQRTVVASRAATVSQIQQQQRMQLLHQQRKAGGQQKVTGLSAGKAGQIPLLIPQNSKLNSQILQQIGLVNKPIQQIIAHSSNQPTIITQVSQAGGQPITHMVAKVSLTTGGQQTLSAGGTPITVTQVSSPTAQGVGLTVAGGQTAAKTAATITSLDSGGSSIQVHSVQPGQKTLGGLTQSLVTAQNVQVQQASSNAAAGTQVSQLLHVTPVSVGTIGATTLSATSTGHSTSITVPPTSQLVASSSALRGATTTLLTSTAPAAGGSNSTAPQISLVTSPVTALTPAATVSTVQVQAISTIDITGDGSTPTVSVASSLSSSLSADGAGSKASPYTMRTRNAKH